MGVNCRLVRFTGWAKEALMSFRSFDQIIDMARRHGRRSIAVARADDVGVLQSLLDAEDEGIVEPILFGDSREISRAMEAANIDRAWSVAHVDGDDRKCADAAVSAVRSGEADLLMKGHLHTSVLLQAVLDRDGGLRRGGMLSHIVFIEVPFYHKLFAMTDGGLNRAPDLEGKAAITRNAVHAFRQLGYERPKVAFLSYVEKVTRGCEETGDWASLLERSRDGSLGDALFDGPMALDLCLSEEAKRIKEFESEVAGDADVIVVPSITVCNAAAKAFFLSGATAAGVVIGASAPIVALSRGDSPRTRLCSIALARVLQAGRTEV